MHFIRYKWDSLYYLIPKFEPDRTSSSRDIPLFHAFWSQGCKKQQKWLYLWNYSSDSAQILGSSSWDCLACTLWSAFTPKSIPFSRKTGVQLEWQCPTLTSLHCSHSIVLSIYACVTCKIVKTCICKVVAFKHKKLPMGNVEMLKLMRIWRIINTIS